MKKLQDFIDQNRHRFDSEEPPLGHSERFRQRLEARIPSHKVNVWLVASVAAIAGLLLTASVSLMLNYSNISSPINNGLTTVNVNNEIFEIDEFYQHQLFVKQQEITTLMGPDEGVMAKDVNQTLNDMKESYKGVRQDIAFSPRPDNALFVLTRYYQTQLDILDGIISKMQNVYTLNQNF
jgi:hypothetical protein